jgi:hypothetical protein
LNGKLPVLGADNIHNRYRHHLQALGLSVAQGRSRVLGLAQAFMDYYGLEYLEKMKSGRNLDAVRSWLNYLTNKPTDRAVHPVRHLLMQRFLGFEAGAFWYEEIEKDSPFGEGPWPCLNAAEGHYLKGVIKDCIVGSDPVSYVPIGVFICSCGFVYSKRSHHWNDDDYIAGNVLIAGKKWEEMLINLTDCQGQTLSEISHKMGMAYKIVERHLRRLLGCDSEMLITILKVNDERKREQYRYEVLQVIKHNVHAESRYDAVKGVYEQYCWLRRHDKEWFEREMKALKKAPKSRKWEKDWRKIDDKLASKISSAIELLKQGVGTRGKITAGKIGKMCGTGLLTPKKIGKLPMTKRTINESLRQRWSNE